MRDELSISCSSSSTFSLSISCDKLMQYRNDITMQLRNKEYIWKFMKAHSLLHIIYIFIFIGEIIVTVVRPDWRPSFARGSVALVRVLDILDLATLMLPGIHFPTVCDPDYLLNKPDTSPFIDSSAPTDSMYANAVTRLNLFASTYQKLDPDREASQRSGPSTFPSRSIH